MFRSTDGALTLEGWTNPAEPLMGVPTARAFDSDGSDLAFVEADSTDLVRAIV